MLGTPIQVRCTCWGTPIQDVGEHQYRLGVQVGEHQYRLGVHVGEHQYRLGVHVGEHYHFIHVHYKCDNTNPRHACTYATSLAVVCICTLWMCLGGWGSTVLHM